MRAYLLYLVGTTIFVDKSVTYTIIVYLWYFKNFDWIHEYNRGGLFGLPVLEVERGLYVEYEAGHRQHHTTTVIIISFLMFLYHFHFIFAKSLLIIHVFQTFHFRLGSSSTPRVSPVG